MKKTFHFSTQDHTDPLNAFLEQHLLSFTEKEIPKHILIERVIEDYLKYLLMQKMIVPTRWLSFFKEELFDQIYWKLFSKTYGPFFQKKKKRKKLKQKIFRTRHSKKMNPKNK